MAPPTEPRKPSRAPSAPPSPALIAYLTLYNALSAAAWGYVLYRAGAHMLGADGYTGLKELVGAQGWAETMDKRARGGVDEFGDVVKWVQTAALFEVAHSALRLVRSPLGTTVAQVASRLALVWGVCEFFPEVPHSPFYISMVTAWSLAEIIRYVHYATGLLGMKVRALEWLRYTAFYILYPVGAGSEAVLIAFSAPYAKEQYGTLAGLAVYALVSIWPPSLFFLMTYMHAQRRKHLGGRSAKASSSKSSSSLTTPTKRSASTAVASFVPSSASTPLRATSTSADTDDSDSDGEPKKAPRDIDSAIGSSNVIQALGSETPARSTRSRAKRAA
ncbi:hypothetical protein JCM6882_000402 [Rhodosporidiobolus microsporus]